MEQIPYADLIQQMDSHGKKSLPFKFAMNFNKSYGYFTDLQNPDQDFQISFNQARSTKLNGWPLQIEALAFEQYLRQFKQIQDHIANGNTYLLNLTVESRIALDIDMLEIYKRSEAAFKLYIKDRCVSFSPERFIRIHENTIVTHPMKGTSLKSQDIDGSVLLADPKETAEHSTIVDLLRNDLSQVADGVHVPRFKYLDLVKTQQDAIWQMSSEIKGQLIQAYHNSFGTIIDILTPAGSISGAPKSKTLEIIHATESHDRDYYTGIFGYFDGEVFDTAVNIRYITERDGQKYYKSGGGITFMSTAVKEYQEILNKIYVPIF